MLETLDRRQRVSRIALRTGLLMMIGGVSCAQLVGIEEMSPGADDLASGATGTASSGATTVSSSMSGGRTVGVAGSGAGGAGPGGAGMGGSGGTTSGTGAGGSGVGGGGSCPDVNGCSFATAVNLVGQTTVELHYAPYDSPCIKVTKNTYVLVSGANGDNFTSHPLIHGEVSGGSKQPDPNPVFPSPPPNASVTIFTEDATSCVIPYYCDNDWQTEKGAIYIVP